MPAKLTRLLHHLRRLAAPSIPEADAVTRRAVPPCPVTLMRPCRSRAMRIGRVMR
jgi:hypothetical protein